MKLGGHYEGTRLMACIYISSSQFSSHALQITLEKDRQKNVIMLKHAQRVALFILNASVENDF